MALAQISNVPENLYYNACESVLLQRRFINCSKQIVSQNQQFILL